MYYQPPCSQRHTHILHFIVVMGSSSLTNIFGFLFESSGKRCFSTKGDLKVGIIGAGRIGQVSAKYSMGR